MEPAKSDFLRIINPDPCCAPEVEAEACTCPVDGVIDTIGKKWALLVVNLLGLRGKMRFGDLRRELPGATPKTLTTVLRELEREGLVRREEFTGLPSRVEYSLTKDGRELRDALLPVVRWAASREK